MKAVIIILFFEVITLNLYAQIKWIPIEPIAPIAPIAPINMNEPSKRENNTSKMKPANQLLENVKTIQYLLDSTRDRDESDREGE
ncbi:MAG: hypothetical protein NTW78_02170 [Campylobacterales bacterium]|nr:hypothetical protein [Campylobacterales bacterium]